jgi:hypothetical protein
MSIHVQGFYIRTIPCQAGAHDEPRLYKTAMASNENPVTSRTAILSDVKLTFLCTWQGKFLHPQQTEHLIPPGVS